MDIQRVIWPDERVNAKRKAGKGKEYMVVYAQEIYVH